MSKFSAEQVVTITVSVPESFRKDLQELADVIEGPMSPFSSWTVSPWSVVDVLEVILDSNPKEEQWSNCGGNLIVKFEKEK